MPGAGSALNIPKLASDYDRVPCSKSGIEVLRSSLYDDRCVDCRSEIRRERAASAAYGITASRDYG